MKKIISLLLALVLVLGLAACGAKTEAPKTEAPYMCIEPWTSVPAIDNVVDDFETKLEMNRLAPGDSYTNSFSITVG